MEPVDSYYDSEEDVYWGPLTVKEIKKFLERKVHVDRRRTIASTSSIAPSQSQEDNEEDYLDDIDKIISDVSQLSINSKYLTPRQTMQSQNNFDNFISKVSEILDIEQIATESNSHSFTTTKGKDTDAFNATRKETEVTENESTEHSFALSETQAKRGKRRSTLSTVTSYDTAMDLSCNDRSLLLDVSRNKPCGSLDSSKNKAYGSMDSSKNEVCGSLDLSKNKADGPIDSSKNDEYGSLNSSENKAYSPVHSSKNEEYGSLDFTKKKTYGLLDSTKNNQEYGLLDSSSNEGSGLLDSCSNKGYNLLDTSSNEGSGLLDSCSKKGYGLLDSSSNEGPGLLNPYSNKEHGLLDSFKNHELDPLHTSGLRLSDAASPKTESNLDKRRSTLSTVMSYNTALDLSKNDRSGLFDESRNGMDSGPDTQSDESLSNVLEDIIEKLNDDIEQNTSALNYKRNEGLLHKSFSKGDKLLRNEDGLHNSKLFLTRDHLEKSVNDSYNSKLRDHLKTSVNDSYNSKLRDYLETSVNDSYNSKLRDDLETSVNLKKKNSSKKDRSKMFRKKSESKLLPKTDQSETRAAEEGLNSKEHSSEQSFYDEYSSVKNKTLEYSRYACTQEKYDDISGVYEDASKIGGYADLSSPVEDSDSSGVCVVEDNSLLDQSLKHKPHADTSAFEKSHPHKLSSEKYEDELKIGGYVDLSSPVDDFNCSGVCAIENNSLCESLQQDQSFKHTSGYNKAHHHKLNSERSQLEDSACTQPHPRKLHLDNLSSAHHQKTIIKKTNPNHSLFEFEAETSALANLSVSQGKSPKPDWNVSEEKSSKSNYCEMDETVEEVISLSSDDSISDSLNESRDKDDSGNEFSNRTRNTDDSRRGFSNRDDSRRGFLNADYSRRGFLNADDSRSESFNADDSRSESFNADDSRTEFLNETRDKDDSSCEFVNETREVVEETPIKKEPFFGGYGETSVVEISSDSDDGTLYNSARDEGIFNEMDESRRCSSKKERIVRDSERTNRFSSKKEIIAQDLDCRKNEEYSKLKRNENFLAHKDTNEESPRFGRNVNSLAHKDGIEESPRLERNADFLPHKNKNEESFELGRNVDFSACKNKILDSPRFGKTQRFSGRADRIEVKTNQNDTLMDFERNERFCNGNESLSNIGNYKEDRIKNAGNDLERNSGTDEFLRNARKSSNPDEGDQSFAKSANASSIDSENDSRNESLGIIQLSMKNLDHTLFLNETRALTPNTGKCYSPRVNLTEGIFRRRRHNLSNLLEEDLEEDSEGVEDIDNLENRSNQTGAFERRGDDLKRSRDEEGKGDYCVKNYKGVDVRRRDNLENFRDEEVRCRDNPEKCGDIDVSRGDNLKYRRDAEKREDDLKKSRDLDGRRGDNLKTRRDEEGRWKDNLKNSRDLDVRRGDNPKNCRDEEDRCGDNLYKGRGEGEIRDDFEGIKEEDFEEVEHYSTNPDDPRDAGNYQWKHNLKIAMEDELEESYRGTNLGVGGYPNKPNLQYSSEDDYEGMKESSLHTVIEKCVEYSDVDEEYDDRNSNNDRIHNVSTESTDYEFNDTLEEMERALKYGLDYSMSNQSDVQSSSGSFMSNPTSNQSDVKKCGYNNKYGFNSSSCNQGGSKYGLNNSISSKSDGKCSLDNSKSDGLDNSISIKSDGKYGYNALTPNAWRDNANKAAPAKHHSGLPVKSQSAKKPEKPKVVSKLPLGKFSHIVSPISVYCSKPAEFKKPANPSIPKPTPLGRFNKNQLTFSKIQSPVLHYIKNTPTVPLQQNTQVGGANKKLFPAVKAARGAKENVLTLPSVVYKPAGKSVVSKEKEIRVPHKIEKLIPAKADIVKHQGRLVKHVAEQSDIERKLLCEDLTIANDSMDSSQVLSSDVSILTSKKAFIK